jgi:hypothetical protein
MSATKIMIFSLRKGAENISDSSSQPSNTVMKMLKSFIET